MGKLCWTCRILQHEDFKKEAAREYTIKPIIINLNEDTGTSEEEEDKEGETEEEEGSGDDDQSYLCYNNWYTTQYEWYGVT